jgi:hypothetical protein
MLRTTNVLELSLATSITPEMSAERKASIKMMPNKVKMVGALALHNFALTFPDLTARLINRDLAGAGYEYVGAGAESTVFRQADNVVKVHRNSMTMDEPQREQLAEQMDSIHKPLRQYLGSFVLDQSIAVDRHPLDPSYRAVQIFQAYCSSTNMGIFKRNDPGIDHDQLYETCSKIPGISSALSEFVAASYGLYDKTGLLPDTTGYGNVVLTNTTVPELRLIDGQPISTEHPEVQAKIMSQLSLVEQALANAA